MKKIGIWEDIGNVEFDGDEVRCLKPASRRARRKAKAGLIKIERLQFVPLGDIVVVYDLQNPVF